MWTFLPFCVSVQCDTSGNILQVFVFSIPRHISRTTKDFDLVENEAAAATLHGAALEHDYDGIFARELHQCLNTSMHCIFQSWKYARKYPERAPLCFLGAQRASQHLHPFGGGRVPGPGCIAPSSGWAWAGGCGLGRQQRRSTRYVFKSPTEQQLAGGASMCACMRGHICACACQGMPPVDIYVHPRKKRLVISLQGARSLFLNLLSIPKAHFYFNSHRPAHNQTVIVHVQRARTSRF